MLGTLCDPSFLFESWKVVRNKGKTAGVDDVAPKDFAVRAEEEIVRIADDIESGSYVPLPYRPVRIKKESGKYRDLLLPAVRDRIVQRALNELLNSEWDEAFLPYSFAYRKGYGVADAVFSACRLIADGRTYFIKGDIKNCFDELRWDVLTFLLGEWLEEKPIVELTEGAFMSPFYFRSRLYYRKKGVPQGSAVSPTLANLYLHPIDYEFDKQGIALIRYADDWMILAESYDELAYAFELMQRTSSDVGLSLNTDKTDLGCLRDQNITFLGYELNAYGGVKLS